MSFIKLTQMPSFYISFTEPNFIEEYVKAQENGIEAVRRVIEKNYNSWKPEGLTKLVIISIDSIESIEEKRSFSDCIYAKDSYLLPSISEVILKNGKTYIVWQSVDEIEKLICEKSE